ncbi:hypothetical protein V6Z11_A11G107800 [Gossypium hirsutum]
MIRLISEKRHLAGSLQNRNCFLKPPQATINRRQNVQAHSQLQTLTRTPLERFRGSDGVIKALFGLSAEAMESRASLRRNGPDPDCRGRIHQCGFYLGSFSLALVVKPKVMEMGIAWSRFHFQFRLREPAFGGGLTET